MTTTTLKDACAAYVEHMKQKGQSPSTCGTIQRTLALLVEEMGEAKEVGKILPVHVDKFFKGEKATMQPGRRAAAGKLPSISIRSANTLNVPSIFIPAIRNEKFETLPFHICITLEILPLWSSFNLSIIFFEHPSALSKGRE